MAVLKPVGTGYPDAFVASVLERALALPGPCRVFGITGLQGTGKSTLSAQVAARAESLGLRAVVLSIDDLYLDQPERQRLGREVHPLLATRGAPGSHDLALGRATFDALRAGRARLPAFDKISDRRLPESDWARIDGVPDLVLFEGWFHKVPPQAEAALVAPINALERDEDPDGTLHQFSTDACCNLRKVEPLEHTLQGFDGWITGRKRFQNADRGTIDFFENEGDFRIKVNPLAHWGREDLDDYITNNNLPRHTLVAKGYPSIGCAPCTSPVKPGEDPRSGRWRGQAKTECGIHFVGGKPVRTTKDNAL